MCHRKTFAKNAIIKRLCPLYSGGSITSGLLCAAPLDAV